MNELINMLPMTSSKEESYTSIYAAERKEENVMAARTGVVRSGTEFREIIAPASLKNVVGLVIGRWIR